MDHFSEYKKRANYFFIEYGKVLVVAILTILLIVCVTRVGHLTSTSKLEISFFDIGQGDAIFIKTPSGKKMLIDGGPNSKVLEDLAHTMSYFDTNIDIVISTHPDADHITGLIPVLDAYTVGQIILSPVSGSTGVFETFNDKIKNEGAELHVAKRGDSIDFGDGVVAYVLHPGRDFRANEKDTNDASVTVVLKYGSTSALLTGDLPSVYERNLISKVLPRNITLYKAGHHGSKYSSGDVLLSYIHPEYAVVSAGKNNTYGHPNPETLGRLKVYSKEILSTIEKGMITFSLDGNIATVRTER
jgi:beta-lactamase superfamily II metal-dependent hydrolase